MRLSAPIYRLKRKAKLMAREKGIALHQALDRIAIQEGYGSWGHLASSTEHVTPARQILAQLAPGDLCLMGARPGQGKTLLGLELASRAPGIGRKGYFFTLEYHERDVEARLERMGFDVNSINNTMVVDTSDDVSAAHIIDSLSAETDPALIVVDYLQLLDQKRSNPRLEDQVASLKRYVTDAGAICVIISQIDRSFDLGGRSMPDFSDVRLPNPLDLSVFNKFVFLHDGKVQLEKAA